MYSSEFYALVCELKAQNCLIPIFYIFVILYVIVKLYVDISASTWKPTSSYKGLEIA